MKVNNKKNPLEGYSIKLTEIVDKQEEFITYLQKQYGIHITLPLFGAIPIIMNSSEYREIREIIQNELKLMGFKQKNNNLYWGKFKVKDILNNLNNDNFFFTEETIRKLINIEKENTQEPLNITIKINSSIGNYLGIQKIIVPHEAMVNLAKIREDFAYFFNWLLIKLKKEGKI